MNKSANIIRWVVFGVLALIVVVLAGLFFWKGIPETGPWKDWFEAGRVGEEPATPFTNLLLNWSYASVILGVVLVIFAFIFMGVVKGLNWKTLLIAIAAIAVIAAISFFLSKNAFTLPYQAGEKLYSETTHGMVEFGLNFFYITLVVAILSVLFSIIYKAVKK